MSKQQDTSSGLIDELTPVAKALGENLEDWTVAFRAAISCGMPPADLIFFSKRYSQGLLRGKNG